MISLRNTTKNTGPEQECHGQGGLLHDLDNSAGACMFVCPTFSNSTKERLRVSCNPQTKTEDRMILTDTGADYEPIPTGIQPAALVNIFNLGLQRNTRGDMNPECVFLWELAGPRKKDGTPFLVTRRYTASLNEKANLRKHLRAWRTRDFTADELKHFDTERLINLNARLNLLKVSRNGREWVDIDGLLPPEGNPTAYKPQTPRSFIPEWISKAIAAQVHPEADNPEIENKEGPSDQGLF